MTNVAQVQHLSLAEAKRGYPVRLRAVVTYYEPKWDTLFMQDETGGAYVFPNDQPRPPYEAGQWIDFTGKTVGSGSFSSVVQQEISVLGTAPLPRPVTASYSQLVAGRLDSQWVEIEGIVRGMTTEKQRIEIDVALDDGRLLAHLPRPVGQSLPLELMHARVKIRGVCSTVLDERDRPVQARLFVPAVDFFSVNVPAVTNVAELPVQPVTSVLRFNPQYVSNPRLRVVGIVTLNWPAGRLFIQDESGGLELEMAHARKLTDPQGSTFPDPTPVELGVGERVEAVGYPALRESRPILEEVEVRKVGSAPVPLPVQLGSEDIAKDRHHGELVQVQARLVEVLPPGEPEAGLSRLLVQCGGVLVETQVGSVSVPPPPASSSLRLTGVWSVTLDERRVPKAHHLLLRSPADLVVLSTPPWWWTGPVPKVVGTLSALILLGLGWVGLLRGQVAQRTAQLRASEARYRTLVEHAPEAIVVLDVATGLFIDANENAARLFGLSRQELLYYGPSDVSAPIQPDGRPSAVAVKEKIQDAVNGGAPRFEWIHRNAAGHDFPCEIRLVRLPDPGRTLVRGSITDITERKRAEEELIKALGRERELGELKSNFVSMVSHEFRTPLEVIMSSGEILQRYFDRLAPDKRKEQLEAIHQSVRRMDRLMDEVLLLSKVEAGKMKFKPERIDPVTICQRIVQEILSATNYQVPIELQVESLPPGACADENLLRHIFTNLLSNAVKYSRAGGSVRFTLAADKEQAVFRVEDRGVGIPTADQDRLFQAFHRGRNVNHLSGTGLGLVIVKRCVDMHGGKISFESKENEGTTFTVTIPLFTT